MHILRKKYMKAKSREAIIKNKKEVNTCYSYEV